MCHEHGVLEHCPAETRTHSLISANDLLFPVIRQTSGNAYTSDVQGDRRGVRRSFKTRLRIIIFCRSAGENKRCLLSRRAADAEVILLVEIY